MYALILAGGSGTRLWPRSRKDCPKQLLNLVSERTMLQETYDRIRPLIPDDKVFVVTNEGYVRIVREQLPQIPSRNVISEPEGHNTAPCIGLGALYLKRLDPEGVMISLHADHFIKKGAEFRRALKAAAQVAEEGHLVTLGIKPACPETGYGYIQRGTALRVVDGHDVYRAKRFTEKPDHATAVKFIESGDYLWNSGIFLWRISVILREIERLMPDLYGKLMEIEPALGTSEEREVLGRVWAAVEDESIDVGIMERSDNVVVIPVDIGWSDIGSWATVYDLLPADEEGNVVVGEHLGVETTGSLIYSPKRLIATVGVKDMVIVDTDDALLVCPKDRAQEVKALVDKLREKNKFGYL